MGTAPVWTVPIPLILHKNKLGLFRAFSPHKVPYLTFDKAQEMLFRHQAPQRSLY